MSLVHHPFQKVEKKNAITYSGQLMYSSGKDWNAKKESKKIEKKFIFLN
jgi:hypothetical protein